MSRHDDWRSELSRAFWDAAFKHCSVRGPWDLAAMCACYAIVGVPLLALAFAIEPVNAAESLYSACSAWRG